MVVTNDSHLAQLTRQFAGLGYRHLTADATKTHLASKTYQNPDYERFSLIGFNYRMSPISASIGRAQLQRAERIRSRRIHCAHSLLKVIYDSSIDWLIPQTELPGYTNTYYTLSCILSPAKGAPSWQDFTIAMPHTAQKLFMHA